MKRMTLMLLIVLCGMPAVAQTSYRGTFRVESVGPAAVAQRSGEGSLWMFRVVRQDGSLATEVRRSIPYDVARPAVFVFESGRILMLHTFDGMAEVYDATGDLVRRTRLTETPAPDHERSLLAAVHDRIAVLSMSDAAGLEVDVIRLDDTGTILSRRRIEAMNTTGIAIASDPSLVAVSTLRWVGSDPVYATSVLDGEDVWSIPAGFRHARFDEQDRLVGLDDRSVFVASVRQRQLLWRAEAGKGRLFLDGVGTEDGVSVLSAELPTWGEGQWTYTAPVIRRLDWSGKLVREESQPVGRFSKGMLERVGPNAVMRADGKRIE